METRPSSGFQLRLRPPRVVPVALIMLLVATEGRATEWPEPDVAAHPCRPTVSCTADLASPGVVEAEAGGLVAKLGNGDRQLDFPVLLKATLTSLLQLQLGSNGYTVIAGRAPARYLDNVFAGPKVHVADQGPILPSIAVTALVSAPTFSEPGYTRNVDGSLVLHASKDISKLHLDANVGADLWRLDATVLGQGFFAVAASTNITPALGAALEGYAFSDAAPAAPRDGGVRAALSLAARSYLVLDAGGDVGFFPSTRAYSVFFGMTIVPVVLWR